VTLFCVAQRLNQLTLEELVSVMAKGLRRLALPASAEKASPLTGLTAHLNFGPLDKEANWVGAMKARQVIDGGGPEITSGELFRIEVWDGRPEMCPAAKSLIRCCG
jgi:hypothetical protein